MAIIQHAEEVTGDVSMACRSKGISRTVYYRWLRRYQEHGVEGLRDHSRRPHNSPDASHVDVVGNIVYLRQNYHFGPARSPCTCGATTTRRSPSPGSGASSNGSTSTGCRPRSATTPGQALPAV